MVRNNVIHDCRQECLYVGGYYRTYGAVSSVQTAFTDLVDREQYDLQRWSGVRR